MSEILQTVCPECNETVDRRDFLRGTAALAATAVLPTIAPSLLPVAAFAAPAAAVVPTHAQKQARPAETLIREFAGTLTANQRQRVVKPWDHRSSMMLSRHRMMNAAIDQKIGQVYTPAQRDLLQRILRSLCSDDTGYDRICRREDANTAWDASQSFENLGADIYGTVVKTQWSFVFTGHHLTVRCDGNSEPDYAFGGPIYYGHTPDGYSQRNVFFHQTRAVLSVYESLSERQRQQAVVVGTPGELEPSIRFRAAGQRLPGIGANDLTRAQRLLVVSVMREVVSPFRREDGDEVMQIVSRNGGLDRIHLAFYRDRAATDANQWHFWRLEGPGFVWNYRVLPHVHTYVNVAVPRDA